MIASVAHSARVSASKAAWDEDLHLAVVALHLHGCDVGIGGQGDRLGGIWQAYGNGQAQLPE